MSNLLPCLASVIAQHPLLLPSANTTRHVRAASGLAWFQDRIGLVQDDTTAIVWLDRHGHVLEEQSLEPNNAKPQHFDATLGNKQLKPDLETVVAFTWQHSNYWLALGSGSSAQRDRAVLLRAPTNTPAQPTWIDLRSWYDLLRANAEFSGVTLNIEAGFVVDQRLYLLQRGNGRSAVNAVAQFDLAEVCSYLTNPLGHAPPSIRHVLRCDLGSVAGVSWGFADACSMGQRQYFLLSAEDSVDAIQDGAVLGTALAFCDHGQFDALQIGAICDVEGQPVRIKLEGLSAIDAETLMAVSDEDDPASPAQCLLLRLVHAKSHSSDLHR